MKSLITVIIIGAVLAFLEKQTRKREKESEMTEEKFLIKLSSGYFWLGVAVTIVGIGLMIWGKMENELSVGLAIMLALATMPGVLVMICPLSGIWEVLVDQDDITVTKCFIFRKHFRFSEITHCKHTRGGWKVYVKNRRRKGFFVDRMMDGAGLFLKRIEAANIPVEEMIRDK